MTGADAIVNRDRDVERWAPSLSAPAVHVIRSILAFALLIALWSTQLQAQPRLKPGEAFVTRFSGAIKKDGTTVIDLSGTVGSIVDLRRPSQPPLGHHWLNEPHRNPITAAKVGQVFGIAIDDTPEANIYVAATSAFGLHLGSKGAGWMPGMWGAEAGPGTIWKLNGKNGYQPEIFARLQLDGRFNSGAALGNIAYDRWNKQFYVSDLETGMIHRLQLSDGADLAGR